MRRLLDRGMDGFGALFFPFLGGDEWLTKEIEASHERIKKIASKTVEQSMREDWEALGRDLRAAMDNFSRNHEPETKEGSSRKAYSTGFRFP